MKAVNHRGRLKKGDPCIVTHEGSPGVLVARPPETGEPTHTVVSNTFYEYGIGGARFDGPWPTVRVEPLAATSEEGDQDAKSNAVG